MVADVRPILRLPDDRLRAAARPAGLPDPAVDQLLDDLLATMAAARGLGLAAPQVGVDLRVAVVEVAGARLELINPRIVGAHGRDRGWEGCLSVPDRVARVERPAEVVVAGIDRAGRAIRQRCTGLLARAVAHEVDHLEGRLYVDMIDPADLVDTREQPTPPAAPPAQTPPGGRRP
jgi:peptide deformylase